MFYFSVSASAINPHCCALEASTLTRSPQVGIRLGAGAISFCVTVPPPQSFIKKQTLDQPQQRTHYSGLLVNRNRKEKRGRKGGKQRTRWLKKDRKEHAQKSPEYLSIRDTSSAPDECQCWAKYVLETKALSPSWASSMNYTPHPHRHPKLFN